MLAHSVLSWCNLKFSSMQLGFLYFPWAIFLSRFSGLGKVTLPRFKRNVATVLGPMDGGQGALGTFIDAFRLV